MKRLSGPYNTATDWTASRGGVILILVALMLTLFVVFVAYSVDVSYMQLTRTQLRVATDAAAKAGAAILRQSQDPNAAVAAAIDAASKNTVDGHPLKLTSADIQLGQSSQNSVTAGSGDSNDNGTWTFVPGAQPYRAVKVTASLSNSNSNGAVKLFFSGLMGTSTFSPTRVAVASHMDQDVVLCLDRSHSMCWDLSGTSWSYPPYNPKGITDPVQLPPDKNLSRWASLTGAVTTFAGIVQSASNPPRVGMITWASTMGTGTYEYSLTGQTSPATTIETPLATGNSSTLISKVNARYSNVMIGGTDMGSGLSASITMLDGSTRPLAKKVIILMSDGQWNTGTNPITIGNTAVTKGYVIHCVGFLKQTDQTTLQNLASMTGGKYYQATDTATLNAAFTDLANSLTVVLTQ